MRSASLLKQTWGKRVMIEKINHIGIAVNSLSKGTKVLIELVETRK